MNRSRDESSSSSVSVASSNGGKSKRMKNSLNSKNPNPNTVEKVRMIMEQEGRSARNLVSWSIPLDSYGNSKGKAAKPKSMNLTRKSIPARDDLLGSSVASNRCNANEISTKKSNPNPRNSGGVRKPVNIRARYWAYLFENLRRAVDEIYATCEGDASVVECKEVLLILDNYHHEFQALIDWINLQERLENTDIHDRPTSLAWEVRKSSPGRPRQKLMQRGIGTGGPQTSGKISRCLNFSTAPDAVVLATAYRSLTGRPAPPSALLNGSFESTGNKEKKAPGTTWADRVKGIKPAPSAILNDKNVTKNSLVNGDIAKTDSIKKPTPVMEDDGEGWETVLSKSSLKHSKLTKTTSDTKIGNSSFENDATPPKSVQHSVESIPQNATPHSTSSYVNKVVDQIIGLERSPLSSGSLTKTTKTVEDAKMQKSQSLNNITQSKRVKFCAEIENYSEEKRIQNDAVINHGIQPIKPSLQNGNLMEDDKLTLSNLEEEAALLAQTLQAEHKASIAVAEQQERDLLRQIQEAKEQETPDVDTDCESARSSTGAKELPSLEQPPGQPLEWAEFVARFEAEQGTGISWNELVEEEELREPGRAVQMHEKLSSPSRKRTPAESRRKQEEKHRRAEQRRQRMHQEKTQKIHELTEKVQEVISWKNDLISRQRNLLQSFHAEKLARAEEQRAMQLQHIKKKAQVEDTKVNEIAFINELQEQNKRHEVLMRIEEHEGRIQELESERTRMLEMKLVKEETVKERRRALEKERLGRIEELKAKRREQIARIEQQKIEKEKEREKLAKERARDREMRLSALNAAQQEAVTELQKKIQLKHNESERRHQVQLEQRKEKALELSLGRFSSLNSSQNASGGAQASISASGNGSSASAKTANGPADIKNPSNGVGIDDKACDEKSSNDSLPSPRSNQSNTDEESKEDLVRIAERKKLMKKRLKKLRTRMASRGKEFMKKQEHKSGSNSSSNKTRIVRLIKDVTRILTNQRDATGPWPTNKVSALDRALGDMNRTMEKQASSTVEQESFRASGGFEILDELFGVFLRTKSGKDSKISLLPDRSLNNAVLVFRNACRGCYDNCVYVLYASKLVAVVDLALQQLPKNAPNRPPSRNNSKKNDSGAAFDLTSPTLLSALATVLYQLYRNPPTNDTSLQTSLLTVTSSLNVLDAYLNRGLDVVSYIVASGIIEVLSTYLKSIRHEVAPGSNMSGFVEHGLTLLESMTSFVALRNRLLLRTASSKPAKKQSSVSEDTDVSFSPSEGDATQLLSTLKQTDLMGILSVLYGLLLHGAPERPTILRSASVNNNLSSVTSQRPKVIPEHTLSVAFAVLSVLNSVAETDLPLLQTSLATEGLSLAFRHICTYLLWYCVQQDHTDLLHEVVRCVGYFTLNNRCNQITSLLSLDGTRIALVRFFPVCVATITVSKTKQRYWKSPLILDAYSTTQNPTKDLVDSGAQPTVLQQLCTLPFSYFSSPPLMEILLPTLIACCHSNDSNLAVFEQEASTSLLVEFIETFSQDREAKGDQTKKANEKKSHQPRSLTDIAQFDSQFLRQALDYFRSENHCDVNSAAS